MYKWHLYFIYCGSGVNAVWLFSFYLLFLFVVQKVTFFELGGPINPLNKLINKMMGTKPTSLCIQCINSTTVLIFPPESSGISPVLKIRFSNFPTCNIIQILVAV